MTKRDTRVRWNEDERNTILAAYRTLHAHEPRGDMAKLFEKALKALPPKRRRKLDYKLRVWLASESAPARGRPPATSAASNPSIIAAKPAVAKRTAARPEATMQTVSIPAALSASKPPRRDDAHAAVSAAAPDAAVLAQVMVERGSEIVADILGSARVQQALRTLLRAAWPTSGAPVSVPPSRDGGPATDAESVAAVFPANGKLRVLVAGMEKREGALFAKTYDDTLELACWSADEGLELLRAAVAGADVVIGMTNLLSQPVEQTVRRHAKRYLRNARGVAGLRGELADLALSGHGALTGEGAAAQL